MKRKLVNPQPQSKPQSEKKKSKAPLIIVLIVLILAAVGAGGWYWWSNQTKNVEEEVAVIEEEVILTPPDLPTILAEAAAGFDLTSPEIATSSLWWVSKDELSIINENAESYVVKLETCHADEVATESCELADYQKQYEQVVALMGNRINETMETHGLVRNIENSSQGIDDKRFYEYVQAYENEGWLVTFSAEPEATGEDETYMLSYKFYLESIAREDYEQNYAQQKDWALDLIGVGFNSAVEELEEQIGEAARFRLSVDRRFGNRVLARYVDGHWGHIVDVSFEPPLCSELEENELPLELIGSCFEENGKIRSVEEAEAASGSASRALY